MPTRELPVPALYRPEHASLYAYRPDPAALLDEATRWRQAHGLSAVGRGRPQVRLASALGQSAKPSWCFDVGTTYLTPARANRSAHCFALKSSAVNLALAGCLSKV